MEKNLNAECLITFKSNKGQVLLWQASPGQVSSPQFFFNSVLTRVQVSGHEATGPEQELRPLAAAVQILAITYNSLKVFTTCKSLHH